MEASFLSTVSVIYGPLSGPELGMWQCFIFVAGLFLCFAFEYNRELGCVEKTHTLTFSQVQMILCSCSGLFHRRGRSLPQQVFKVKTGSHSWFFLPDVLASSLENLSSGPACFLKTRISTSNLIHNSGEKLFPCTSLRWKTSLRLLGPGFG